jgi:exopolysaccharide biosynthesis protein
LTRQGEIELLRRSTYAHRFLYAGISAFVLILASAVILLNTFVWVRIVPPMDTGFVSFTPVPSKSPVQTVYTDTEYTDSHIQIKITKTVKTNPNLVYYVADIKMDSAQYFKNSFAKDDIYRLNNLEVLSSQATRHNAILAINSDDCGVSQQKLTIRNGVLYNDNFSDEVLVLLNTGEMRIVKGVKGADLLDQGVVHSYSFGPTLVLNGQYAQRSSNIAVANPRTGIGMIAPLHYIFIVVDGRRPSHSAGMKMSDFAQLFVDNGCQIAYNLDGGGSSEMYFHNKIVNVPDDGASATSAGEERPLSDIIYIGEQ